jgi:capsular exopolysaccharide synthesis family protein
VTSSIKGEGKSVISANLAITLARRERTLLIDGDMHQAGLREVLGSQRQPGLADWWRHPEPIVNLLTRLEGRSLWYLSAGDILEDPLEILQSPRLAEMLSQVAGWFDWIIIDSPPLVPVPDSGLWASHADGTLLVVRHGRTPKSLLTKALETDNLKLLGIVTNEWEDMPHHYYGRYYGYGRKTSVAASASTPASERKSLKAPNSASR